MARTAAFEIETRDWKADRGLARCTLATRGAWFEILCDMHDNDRSGEVTGTVDELAMVARCLPDDMSRSLEELRRHNVADITMSNTVVTIRNRRMHLEANRRKLAAERQAKHRAETGQTGGSNGEVTQDGQRVSIAFEQFWIAFPRLRRKDKRKAFEAFQRAAIRSDVERIITGAADYSRSDVGNSKWCKGPEPWLNGDCWDDDRAAWSDLERHQPLLAKEYRQVTLEVFLAHKAAGDFLIGPKQDAEPDAAGFRRVHGQLKSKKKIESNTNPDWQPDN